MYFEREISSNAQFEEWVNDEILPQAKQIGSYALKNGKLEVGKIFSKSGKCFAFVSYLNVIFAMPDETRYEGGSDELYRCFYIGEFKRHFVSDKNYKEDVFFSGELFRNYGDEGGDGIQQSTQFNDDTVEQMGWDEEGPFAYAYGAFAMANNEDKKSFDEIQINGKKAIIFELSTAYKGRNKCFFAVWTDI